MEQKIFYCTQLEINIFYLFTVNIFKHDIFFTSLLKSICLQKQKKNEISFAVIPVFFAIFVARFFLISAAIVTSKRPLFYLLFWKKIKKSGSFSLEVYPFIGDFFLKYKSGFRVGAGVRIIVHFLRIFMNFKKELFFQNLRDLPRALQ